MFFVLYQLCMTYALYVYTLVVAVCGFTSSTSFSGIELGYCHHHIIATYLYPGGNEEEDVVWNPIC